MSIYKHGSKLTRFGINGRATYTGNVARLILVDSTGMLISCEACM
ncbi:hypothetical protein [Rheinheimera baltica]